MSLKIGIDYNGVCKSKLLGQDIINIPDCLKTLTRLKEKGHKLYLVSYCGAAKARPLKLYLENLCIFDDFYFVKNRSFKNLVCKYLGLDVLIDDRLDIIKSIQNSYGVHFYFENHESNKNVVDYIPKYSANNWNDVKLLLDMLEPKNNVPDENYNIKNLCHLMFNKTKQEIYNILDCRCIIIDKDMINESFSDLYKKKAYIAPSGDNYKLLYLLPNMGRIYEDVNLYCVVVTDLTSEMTFDNTKIVKFIKKDRLLK
jgi:hypothetical protein